MGTVIKNGIAITELNPNKGGGGGGSMETIMSTGAADTPQGVVWHDGEGVEITGTLVPSQNTTNKLYFVPAEGQGEDMFDEYITLLADGDYVWERFGRAISVIADIIYGYMNGGIFYKTKSGSSYTEPIVPEINRQYTDKDTGIPYIWDGSSYMPIGRDMPALLLQSGSDVTIEGYAVPALTAEQITSAYNAIVAGRGCIIVDRNGSGHFYVNQADALNGDITIEILFYNSLLISYVVSDGGVEVFGNIIGGGGEVIEISLTGDSGTLTSSQIADVVSNKSVVLINGGRVFALSNKLSTLSYRTYMSLDAATSEELTAEAIYIQTNISALNYGSWTKESVTISGGGGNAHPYLSLERLRPYLYKVTFDSLPEDNGGELPISGGCSSFVRDGKLYRNLDFNYDNAASFIVRTRDFEGMSFVTGLNDGEMDDSLIAQLPYRVVDGRNNNGIMVSTHVLFNDWEWIGAGNRSVSLTRLPFEVLSRVKSMATIATDLDGILNNLYASAGLLATEYLLQVLVTDGTTTYALLPPTSEGQGYVLQDITSNPKLANFRWVSRSEVARTDSDIQTRPTGIERWNMMPCELSELRFTKAYETPTRLSEFIGIRETTKYSTDAELEAIYDDARAIYLDRERDGRTWQTMHSIIYGDGMEHLWIQEDWNDDAAGKGQNLEAGEGLNIEDGVIGINFNLVATCNYVDEHVAGKQDTIADLSTIRTGAGLGATAVQPAAIASFITASVDNLVNYYKKTETYTQTEVQQLIDAVKQFSYEAVSSLPTASASTMHKIYLVPSSNPETQNIKDEYITIDNGTSASTRYTWEKIGDTAINLSAYRTSAQQDVIDAGKEDTLDFFTSTEINDMFDDIMDETDE